MIYERRLWLKDSPMRAGKELYIYTELPDGKIEVEMQDGDTITTKTYGRGEANIRPSLFLGYEELQLLADELQRLNIRPHEAGKTEGLYEAQTEHLKDLRKLLKLKP